MRFDKLLAAIALAAAPLAAHAENPRQARQAEVAATIAALPATGKVRDCLQLRDVRASKPVGSRIILFETGANRWYRNDLPAACGADDTTAFVYRSFVGNICSIDTMDVVDTVNRISRGFCRLGKFTPVEIPKGTRF